LLLSTTYVCVELIQAPPIATPPAAKALQCSSKPLIHPVMMPPTNRTRGDAPAEAVA
jgi:hypothetical protein